MDKSRMAHRIAGFGALTVFAVSAAAHHGPHAEPLYDTSQLVELEGVVTDVFWRNPHGAFSNPGHHRSADRRDLGDGDESARAIDAHGIHARTHTDRFPRSR